ncbi:hypothetical protein, partial [Staphylococcus aureus]|uniref:hypothetical protein n=1 Tax=Staphylococcus aureus TaxID=1280 RepID=UPI0038B3CB71
PERCLVKSTCCTISKAHAEGLKYCPVLEQRRIYPAVLCGPWNIAVALLRIIITTGLDIGAK